MNGTAFKFRPALLAGTALVCLALSGSAQAQFADDIELANLNGATGFRLDGEGADDLSGFSVSAAGDVNGDGFGDLIIGAQFARPGDRIFAGSSFVVFGKAQGFAPHINLAEIDGSNGFRLDGVADGDESGYSVSGAGDVNGDGFGDLIIGAPSAGPDGHPYAGASYVVFGKARGFASAINLAEIDGSNGFRLDGAAANNRSGISVSAAGDVNGDGFGDLIIGAAEARPGNLLNAGASYVVFGKARGFASAMNLGRLTGATGFRLDGAAANDFSGESVSGAGDINGDGFADLIVGAPDADPNGDRSGSSYVVFGRKSGFAATLALSSLNSSNGFRIDGAAATDASGVSISGAGDVNGDGFGDLIIGAPSADPGGRYNAGSSYVLFGKVQGFASAIKLAELDGSNGFRLDGAQDGEVSGGSVSAAGDVNGDGFGDLIIGAGGADRDGHSAAGSSYVVFGNANGFAATISLGSLNGATGFRLDGEAFKDFSGSSVSAAGDVNRDGFGDLIIGAHGADPGGLYLAGASYVVFGRKPDQAVHRIAPKARRTVQGGDQGDILDARRAGDRLEGRGGGDTLNGSLTGTAASYAHAPEGVVANLFDRAANTGDAAGDAYNAIFNLIGSKFPDTLTGDGNANRLTGGEGKDTLRGRGGKDVFVYRKSSESPEHAGDVIVDFNPNATDLIDLSRIDADTSVGGRQDFSFIGTASFTSPGQVRVQLVGVNLVVSGNTGGTLAPEFEISLKGLTSTNAITAADFKL